MTKKSNLYVHGPGEDVEPVWKSTTPSSRRSYGDNTASMAGRLKFDFHTGREGRGRLALAFEKRGVLRVKVAAKLHGTQQACGTKTSTAGFYMVNHALLV